MEGETHSSPKSDIAIVVDSIKNHPRCTAKNLSKILGWDLRRVQKILKILSESSDPSIKNYKIRRFPPERSNTGFTYTVIDENEANLSELSKSEESQNNHIAVQKETAVHLTQAAQEVLQMMQKIPGQIYTAKNIKNRQQCSLDTAQRILNSIFKAYPNQIHKRRLQKTGEYEYSYTAITDSKTEVRNAPIVTPMSRTVHPTKEEVPIPKDSISPQKPVKVAAEFANIFEDPYHGGSNHLSRTSFFYQHLLKTLIEGNKEALNYFIHNPLGIQFYLRDVLDLIAMVKNPTAFQLLHFIHQKPSWFKGNSLHELYVIDLNHLLARAHANKISNRQLRNWLEGIVKNSEIAHRVIFFSSRNRCPPADFNQFNGNWQYEENYKDPENQKLMDVDTYIVSWLTISLFQHSQEISGIYLFSGDKDLYHVIKTANAFKIPVVIGVISHEDCALEIRTLAKSVLELESWFYERLSNANER